MNLFDITKFLKSKNPTWNMVKISFIAYLIWQILQRHVKQGMVEIPPFYKKILKKGNKTIWYDELSDTYAIDDGKSVTPFDNIDDAKAKL